VETEATGTILYFSVLYGLWVAQHLGGEPVAALEQGKEFLSLAPSQMQPGLLLVGHRLAGSALAFTRRRYCTSTMRWLCTNPKSTASLRPGLARISASQLYASVRGSFGIAAIQTRRAALSVRGSGMPDNPFIGILSFMPLSIRV